MRTRFPFSMANSSQGVPSFFLLLLLLGLCSASFAQAPNDARAGEFYLTSPGGQRVLALHQKTDVTMDISGMTARVNVRQEFTNDTGEWQEGVYVFPLPDDSAVNAMRMLIGDREVIGEIREREEAKREYAEARREGRRAALTEQQRPNLFTQKLANIGPGASITVELQYIQAVHYEDGRFRLRFPMTVTPRYIPGTAASPTAFVSGDGFVQTPASSDANTLSMTVRIDAGLKLTRAGSTTHDMAVATLAGSGGKVVMQLRGGRTRMDRDFELEWAQEAAAAPQAAVFVDPRGGSTMTCMKVASLRGREVIIVLDSSGSMEGTSIVQAKESVRLALNGLRAGDYFNIVDFDSTFHTLFPASQLANTENLQRARAFIDSVQADGGTEMYPALAFALTEPPAVVAGQDLLQQVVFVTDGAVGNEDALFALINSSLDDARLFTVGIGSAPNSHFMRKAAEAGRGTYTYISDTARVTEAMGALMRKLENAVMADLSLEWPAGVVAESYPENLPDLYLGEPLFVTARLSGNVRARQKILVSGTLDGQSWQQELSIDAGGGASTAGRPISDSSLASYWARQKIDKLLDSANASDPAFKARLRQQVLDVALPYQLLSPYTSFIASEKQVARPVQANLATTAIGNEAPAGQVLTAQMAQQVQFPRTATAAGAWMLAGSLMLLCAALALLSLRREKEYVHTKEYAHA